MEQLVGFDWHLNGKSHLNRNYSLQFSYFLQNVGKGITTIGNPVWIKILKFDDAEYLQMLNCYKMPLISEENCE